jgi:D-alanyl-D-alanine endopeptidase (penicillin-binding protein 7)
VKLALRIFSTLVVVAGAVLTIHVAIPVVDASVPSHAALAQPSPVATLALGSLSAVAPTRTAAPEVVPGPAEAASPADASTTDTAQADAAQGDAAQADATVATFDLPVRAGDPTAWVHPTWFPDVLDVDAVADMDGAPLYTRGPPVRSRSVFVYDLDAGQVLFEKNADVVRPVASLTKMVSALTLMSVEPDLDTELCVGAAQYPTRSGAKSHLSTGDCIAGWDVLGAALVASDNRGAYALAAISGLDMDDFVAHMDQVSADLGMDRSSWSDPSGLEDENLSTARDIARATVAIESHPVLSVVATAPYWDVHRTNTDTVRRLFSTDHLLGRDDITVLAAKTGYTDTARYCFSTVVQTRDGRRLAITLLGAEGKQTRWADMDRILRWADDPDSAI